MKDESVLGFLMEVSCLLEEGVAPTVLQLLQAALCPSSKSSENSSKVSLLSCVFIPVLILFETNHKKS